MVPLALAMAGALFVAFALMVGAGKGAAALTNCSVSHDANDGEELAFLTLINNYRQQNGLGTLTISTNLNRGAAWMAEDLATNNYFSHTDSLGRSPYQRGIDCGYPSGAGENLAAGGAWSSAAAAFQAWQNSPGHNANMLGQYYQQIGIARYYGASSQYGWYWATTFGTLNDGTGGGGAGPTNTPTNVPTSTPTKTPTQASATNTPTPVVPTSTPTAFPPTSTPTPNNGGGAQPSPTQPLPTSTPTKTPTQAPNGSNNATNTPVPNTPTPTNTSAATPTQTATNTPTPKATNTPAATATPTSPAGSLPLSPGANFVAWPGTNMSPAQAFAGNTTVAVVYEWDPVNGQWKRYFPGLPAYVNNLTTMKQGGAYWIIAKTKSAVTFQK
ncbi:MAG: CAP domain-containing protein [Dehalococcoidia bacterium]